MPASDHRLTTIEMAHFAHDGFLRFDALVPPELNTAVLDELPALEEAKLAPFLGVEPAVATPATSTPLSGYRTGTALGEVFALPALRGIIESLVGADPVFDHDFVHHLRPSSGERQHLHPDAIVDTTDPSFDIQVFYFPHDVRPGEGGTRFVPGSHLRRTTSTATAALQHVVGDQRFAGPAGTVLVFHHGLWHAGDDNPSDRHRWMVKVRLNPVVPQVRLWNLDDFDAVHNDHTDHIFATSRPDSVAAVFRRPHPWQSVDAQRYDLVERIRLWRYLSGDPTFDADYYLTRHEHRLARTGMAAAHDAVGSAGAGS
ncbi:MAG: phytanoyl-CoA dioxygenase family protein [Acidimicrobiales bacterium]